ncbi:tetraspanin-15-like [Iris pallida]|uniref:Tetraspanin-15-like n=1 Tax=Iris pallida TaxID=29817 RepID=A0AAX6GAA6_IRIPA|nr:tetraspanin-15-like [Iris pallida]
MGAEAIVAAAPATPPPAEAAAAAAEPDLPPGPSFVVDVPPPMHGATPPARLREQPPKLITLSNAVAAVTYLSSFPLLGYGVWLLATRDLNCEGLLLPADGPGSSSVINYRAGFGAALLVAFAASCFFAYGGAKVLHPGAAALACLLVVMLVLGVVFLGSFAMESRGVPFSPMWVRTRVAREDTWAEVRTCLHKSRVCRDMAFRTIELSPDKFKEEDLPPIESGCCKPPELCGMEYVNATYWNRPRDENPPPNGTYAGGGGGSYLTSYATTTTTTATGNSSANPKTFGDCLSYSNVETQLCYECQSCKEGFIKSVNAHWKKLGEFLISMSVILLTVHAVRFVVTMITRE